MRTELFLLVTLGACAPEGTRTTQQAATSCGPGTHLDGTTCVLDTTRYEVQVGRKLGRPSRRNRVVVVATNPDGTPLVDDVVLSIAPAAAGTLTASETRTSRIGGETFFTACDPEEVQACPTTATLTVARRADPSTPVATVALELVDPVDVSPAKNCLNGGNVVKLDGNDGMLNGTRTLVDAPFTFLPTGVHPDTWHATVTPTSSSEVWTFDFNAAKLFGDLVVGKTYDDARRAEPGFTDQVAFRPAMYIRRTGFDCATVTGSFTVVDYAVDFSTPDPGTKRATFAFEQHCEGDPQTAITGCVHFEAPFP